MADVVKENKGRGRGKGSAGGAEAGRGRGKGKGRPRKKSKPDKYAALTLIRRFDPDTFPLSTKLQQGPSGGRCEGPATFPCCNRQQRPAEGPHRSLEARRFEDGRGGRGGVGRWSSGSRKRSVGGLRHQTGAGHVHPGR